MDGFAYSNNNKNNNKKKINKYEKKKKMASLPQDFRFCLFDSLTTKKQTTKFSSAHFQKLLSPGYITLRIQRLESKQCRSR